MDHFHLATNFLFLADLILRVGLSLRVIGRRLSVGVSLAWLAVILILPFVGASLYLLVGEYRTGRRRARRARELAGLCKDRFPQIYASSITGWAGMGTGSAALARVAE